MTDDEGDPQVRVIDRRWWARRDAEEEAAADQGAVAASLKPTYVEDLERRLANLTTQLQTALAERQRALDEFEQVRARMRRDTAREVERGRRVVLVQLLDVLDNLERAIAAGREAGAAAGSDGLARGVELVRDQFLARLQAFGVERLRAAGEPFDVMRHEAISTAPVDDISRDGIVVTVVKDGYIIGDEVLRPATVVVGKAS
jgi:molecular chaperone GrpE